MEWYRISDMRGLCMGLRDDAFNNPVVGYPHESIGFDGYVTIKQIESRVREVAKKVRGGLCINSDMIADLRVWVVDQITSSALARLAADDVIDVMVDENGGMTFHYIRKEELPCELA